MAFITAEVGNVAAEGPKPPRLKDTYRGYTIEEDRDPFEMAGISEPMVQFIGLVFLVSAFVQWFLPASFYPHNVLFAKTGVSAFLGAVGIGLYWFGTRGRTRVVDVDLSRRLVSVARRNSRGELRVSRVYPMKEIGRASLRRSPVPGLPSELMLGLRNGRTEFCVATGDEADLLAIHRKLSADFRPARMKVEERLAEVIAFRTTRTT